MLPSFIVIFMALSIVETAKILIVTPTPSISHQLVFRSVIEKLINRDHSVTFITPDPVFPEGKTLKKLIEIDVHNLSYTMGQKAINILMRKDQNNPVSLMDLAYRTLFEIVQSQLRDKLVLKLMTDKSTKFDLLILEECSSSILMFSHIFEAPVILMSSFGDNRGSIKAVGGTSHPFLYPTLRQNRIYNLTIWEKISELYNEVLFFRMFKNLEIDIDKYLQNFFGMHTLGLSELKNNIHMLFLNTHRIWLHNQPVPLSVVHTWNIHKSPEKKMSQDLNDYLDLSKSGIIYISFGTNFKTSEIHPETLKILIGVFSRLPFDILWKWDSEELPGKSQNIKISKWLPQSHLLRHPNVKLFITQGGLQSTDEAISAGVPLIGIPVFMDQEYNTEKYVHFKIGIKLNYRSLTSEDLEGAINTVFSNYASYKQNIINLRTLMEDQPTSTLEHAIWWMEYVIRHGGVGHLRSPAANMSWTEYYEVELVLILISAMVIIVTVVLLILYYFVKRVSLLRFYEKD